MNNHRLLAGLLCAVAVAGSGMDCAAGEVYSLEEIFRVAEAQSTQMRMSRAAEVEADRGVDESRTGRLPDINASLSFSYIGDGFTTKRNFSDYQKAPIPHFGNNLGVVVSQPVYTGGAITSSIEMAELKSTAARLATDLRRDNLRMRLTGYYLDIYKFSNLRRVVESNLESERKVLADMRARYEQGTVLYNDITRYELLISNLELELTRIDNTLKILNDNLVTAAGLPDGTVVAPDSTLLSRSLRPAPQEACRMEAMNSSPSLKLAESQVDICRKAESLVKADRLPKIGLQAGWMLDGPILTEIPPIDRNLSYWFVGVGVTYNLGSLYKTNKSLARSRAATFAAQCNLDDVREEVDLSVRDNYVRYLESQEVLRSRSKAVELAKRNYATISTRYGVGMALITELLDAANARLDAEQQQVNAEIDIIYNYYKLLFVSGQI